MLDLVNSLLSGSKVLDLGARSGSFTTHRTDLCLVRLDMDPPPAGASGYVQADAARLPFPDSSFDAIVSNHSLEHFSELDDTIREIGRVAKPGSVLYAAVPDSTTLTDRVYRWLGKGGGHVNAFRTAEQVIGLIEQGTAFRHRSTTLLFSSLSFLNRHNIPGRLQRKMALFAWGNERFLAWFTWFLRRVDLAFGTRLSVYGWAFRFGPEGLVGEEATAAWRNVCVRCGSGAAEDFLRHSRCVRRRIFFLEQYDCPTCGAANLLTPDG